MLPFKNIQAVARDTIKNFVNDDNVQTFKDELVVADLGNSKKEIEEALEGRGLVIEVDPPGSGDLYNRQGDVEDFFNMFLVHIKKNPARPGTLITDAFQDVISALKRYASAPSGDDDSSDRFELIDYMLAQQDEGLYAYVQVWRKLSCFN